MTTPAATVFRRSDALVLAIVTDPFEDVRGSVKEAAR